MNSNSNLLNFSTRLNETFQNLCNKKHPLFLNEKGVLLVFVDK